MFVGSQNNVMITFFFDRFLLCLFTLPPPLRPPPPPSPLQVENDKRQKNGDAPLGADEEARIKDPILEKFERESSPYYSSSRLWDDGVIDPADTRRVLGLSLRVAAKDSAPATSFGVFRM